MVEVPEVQSNVCGTIQGRFMITALADDPVKRDYGVFNVHDHESPETPTQLYIASLDVSRWRWKQSMATTQHVLEIVRDRSLHFPKLMKAGRVKRLIFGFEGVQELENDPECFRSVLILKYPLPYHLLSHLPSFSPSGTLPAELALQIGWGMVRAVAALHRSGFVHRLISPHSFSYVAPPTIDNLINRLLITDLSLCMPFPSRPRTNVPFVGTMRYSALKAHQGREQGPSTDLQSIIFVVAEMISGRLAWRSVVTLRMAREMKELFSKTQEFRRLPRELRKLYRDMMLTSPQSILDYQAIQETFKMALTRRSQNKSVDLPIYLCQPCDE